MPLTKLIRVRVCNAVEAPKIGAGNKKKRKQKEKTHSFVSGRISPEKIVVIVHFRFYSEKTRRMSFRSGLRFERALSLLVLVSLMMRPMNAFPVVPVSPFLGRPVSTTTTTTTTRLHARGRKVLTAERPVELAEEEDLVSLGRKQPPTPTLEEDRAEKDQRSLLPSLTLPVIAATSTALTVQTAAATVAQAAETTFKEYISSGTLNPENFSPVCPTSDGFYRFLQSSTVAVVGKENFVDYGPLIAGGLLRVRLELCVVESFFNEAVGPFIQENGLSWILPLRETVETFLAGAIFAVATTFILIGSTKILTVIVTYADFLLGLPARLLGGFAFDRAQGKPVTLDIGLGPFKTRVIGPPKEVEEAAQQNFDVMKASIPELIVLFISGVVRYFGVAFGVRSGADGVGRLFL
jgi:hypothetical protein